VTEDDYRLIEKARRLVDQVNVRLSARGATLAYAVTCNPVGPVQTRAAVATRPYKFSESQPGAATRRTTG
jgi:hypothetical protein